MAKILTRCPVCEAALSVTELACVRCKTSVHGRFETCRFCRLPPEHLAFIELFLRSEGNLSRVEKQLGLSYPTVRNRLSAALAALGFGEDEEDRAGNEGSVPAPPAVEPGLTLTPEMLERRREILDSLAEGSLSADEAAEALRDLT